MNPLGNGNIPFATQLPTQMQQSIQQIKNIMRIAQGNPMAFAQQNPMFNQVLQMCKGQNPQTIFTNMCKQMGYDPNVILNALQN